MKKLILFTAACLISLELGAAEKFADQFVWIFGWGLQKDSDVAEISSILFETAGEHYLNGAVVSFGLDTLCTKSPDFFKRVDQIKKVCDDNHLELIPSIFSIGYGGGALSAQPQPGRRTAGARSAIRCQRRRGAPGQTR